MGGFSGAAAGCFQNEEADVEGCIDPNDDGCTAGPKSRACKGDGGCSFSALESWRRRSGCLEGRDGAVVKFRDDITSMAGTPTHTSKLHSILVLSKLLRRSCSYSGASSRGRWSYRFPNPVIA